MNIPNILSVDPGQYTLGTLHKDIAGKILRNAGITRDNEPSHSKYMLNLISVSAAPGRLRYGFCILMFRLMFAAILIMSGSFILSGEINTPTTLLPANVFAITEITIGSMLALGFLSRGAMIASFLCFGAIAITKITAGIFSVSSLMMCMSSFFFLILGSGKLSCDFLIRKAIILHNRRRRRRLVAQRMSYRAYRVSNL